MTPIRAFLGAIAAAALFAAPARACSLCGGDLMSRPTFRQEAASAQVLVYGTLTNPRLDPNSVVGGGQTDLIVEQVIKSDPILTGKKTITIPRYLPIDAKNPPKWLVVADVTEGRLDVLRARPVNGPASVDYLKAVIKLDDHDRPTFFRFFFEHLDSPAPDVAADAFLEFAKSSDKEVGEAAKKLDPQRLRAMLKEAPAERLGLLSFLLAACGTDADADLLIEIMRANDDRANRAFGGLLAGYIALRPDTGWKATVSILGNPKVPVHQRLAAINALRFFQGWRPGEFRERIQPGLEAALNLPDIADMAVEDLRRWGWWDLTGSVLEKFGRKTHDAPIVRQAIVRYALCCPKPEATRFVADLRKSDPKLVEDVAEGLELDKPRP